MIMQYIELMLTLALVLSCENILALSSRQLPEVFNLSFVILFVILILFLSTLQLFLPTE